MTSIYLLLGHIGTLFICNQFNLIINFPTEITKIGGGKEKYFKVNVLNNNKTVIITSNKLAQINKVKSNFHFSTKTRPYDFYIHYNDSRCNSNVNVYHGDTNSAFRLKEENETIQYFEGERSIKIVNKSKVPIKINGKIFNRNAYFSKGIPLFIDKNPKSSLTNLLVQQ